MWDARNYVFGLIAWILWIRESQKKLIFSFIFLRYNDLCLEKEWVYNIYVQLYYLWFYTWDTCNNNIQDSRLNNLFPNKTYIPFRIHLHKINRYVYNQKMNVKWNLKIKTYNVNFLGRRYHSDELFLDYYSSSGRYQRG